MPRPAILLLLLLLAGMFGGVPGAVAEDPPAEEAPPAAEDAPVDVLAFLEDLETTLEAFLEPPEKTATNRALYDAWYAILRPRAARMLRRVKQIRKSRRWETDPAGERPAHLKPEAWTTVIRELASLYAELGGALEQYEGVDIVLTPRRWEPGISPPRPPRIHWIGLGLSELRRLEHEFRRRRHLGHIPWRREVYHYWDLARRIELQYELYDRRRREWEEAQAELEDLEQKIEGALRFRREVLSLQMLSVRTLTAALQTEEENRLRERIEALPADSTAREAAEPLARKLREARLDAEDHTGAPAEYGAILRSRWLGARKRLLKMLDALEED
ncbi:MAG: hypothetical protein ACYTG6_16475 [Planctomycetota bacterium]